jgi:hypothetical protein
VELIKSQPTTQGLVALYEAANDGGFEVRVTYAVVEDVTDEFEDREAAERFYDDVVQCGGVPRWAFASDVMNQEWTGRSDRANWNAAYDRLEVRLNSLTPDQFQIAAELWYPGGERSIDECIHAALVATAEIGRPPRP